MTTMDGRYDDDDDAVVVVVVVVVTGAVKASRLTAAFLVVTRSSVLVK